MLWMILGCVAVFIGAALSLWASRDSRLDIASGNPKFESVADVTGIWKRESLDAILGPAGVNDRYQVTPSQIGAIRRPAWKVCLDSEVGDCLCLVAAIISPLIHQFEPTFAQAMLVFAAGYLITGYVWISCVLFRAAQ